jgi:hypothetical protein
MGEIMDLKDVPGVAWVFLITAMFFVVSLLILGSLQVSQVASATATNESITLPAAPGTVTLDNTHASAITSIKNASNVACVNYTLSDSLNSVVTFTTLNGACPVNGTAYVIYTYDNYGATVPAAITSMMTATNELPTNWFVIIAIVIAASIVIGVLMNNLGSGLRR